MYHLPVHGTIARCRDDFSDGLGGNVLVSSNANTRAEVIAHAEAILTDSLEFYSTIWNIKFEVDGWHWAESSSHVYERERVVWLYLVKRELDFKVC